MILLAGIVSIHASKLSLERTQLSATREWHRRKHPGNILSFHKQRRFAYDAGNLAKSFTSLTSVNYVMNSSNATSLFTDNTILLTYNVSENISHHNLSTNSSKLNFNDRLHVIDNNDALKNAEQINDSKFDVKEVSYELVAASATQHHVTEVIATSQTVDFSGSSMQAHFVTTTLTGAQRLSSFRKHVSRNKLKNHRQEQRKKSQAEHEQRRKHSQLEHLPIEDFGYAAINLSKCLDKAVHSTEAMRGCCRTYTCTDCWLLCCHKLDLKEFCLKSS